MDKKNYKMLFFLASLDAMMVAHQGKAATVNYFDYESASSMGEIQDMVLSSDNRMFALKTKNAEIDGSEYPVWVGNTDGLSAAFASPWMTNTVASCAFFKDKLYIAPKAQTNHLYRVDVGNNKIPHVKSATELKFDAQGATTMHSPYLYATTNNLYAIEDTADGVQVYALGENNEQSLSLKKTIPVNSSNGRTIQKSHIKDIVSKTINNQDCLYILTTNGHETANLWLVKENATAGECITPSEFSEYSTAWFFTPMFDYTTTMAVHRDKLLVANANHHFKNEKLEQLGWMFPIENDGKLGEAQAYIQSDTYRVSAIGSDQQTYYAEAINDDRSPMDVTFDKYFMKGTPKDADDAEWNYNDYPDRSSQHKGEAVHKFTTQKKGEIFAISKNRIYRIRNNTR